MTYTRTTWANGAGPALNATNLNNIEEGIASLGGAIVNVKSSPYSAAGNGSTDDTTAIQNAVNAVQSAGGGTVLLPSGTYISNTIYITASKVTLRGVGAQATILKRKATVGSGNDARLIAVNSTGPTNTAAAGSYLEDITVADMQLDGNNANVTTTTGSSSVWGTLFFGQVRRAKAHHVYVLNPRECGIHVRGCIDADVDSCTIDGMLGDNMVNSINIQGDSYNSNPGFTYGVRPCEGIRVRGTRVVKNWAMNGDSAAGYGIAICIQGSNHVSIIGCEVDLSGEPAARGRNGYGIMFEGGFQSTAMLLGKNYIAANNKINYCETAIAAADNASPITDTTGILNGCTFTGNEIYDCVEGIKVQGQDATVTGNVINAQRGIRLGCNRASIESNYTVVGNKVYATNGDAIISDKQTTGGDLKGIIIANNLIDLTSNVDTDAAGVALYGMCSGFNVSNNLIKKSPGPGILLDPKGASNVLRCSAGRIIGNTILEAVQTASLTGAKPFGIGSAGCDDVLVALNHITGGAGMANHTGSINTGKFTIHGNTTTAAAVPTDSNNAALWHEKAGSVTWDPPSLANGVAANTTVTVTGAAVGDTVLATHSSVETSAASWTLTGYVSAANTVRVVLVNFTGGTVDLASGTLRVRVIKAASTL